MRVQLPESFLLSGKVTEDLDPPVPCRVEETSLTLTRKNALRASLKRAEMQHRTIQRPFRRNAKTKSRLSRNLFEFNGAGNFGMHLQLPPESLEQTLKHRLRSLGHTSQSHEACQHIHSLAGEPEVCEGIT